MTRTDAVSPELAAAVFVRDGYSCVAPRLGGSVMDCWGRDRREHVKAESRMGKRAEACLCRLLTLCEGHTEPGMKAGYVWATDRRNRERCRDYLASFGYSPHVKGHLDYLIAGGVNHDAHVDRCPGCPPLAVSA